MRFYFFAKVRNFVRICFTIVLQICKHLITFRPVVNYRRKDGTYAVRIRVTFARRSRYLATTLVAYPEQLTRSGKIRDAALNAAADNLVRDMRAAAASLNPFALEGRDVDYVCDYIRQRLRGSSFRLDFFEWADEWLAGKAPSTAGVYRTAVNNFARHLGRRSVDINDITKAMLQDYLLHAEGLRKDRSAGANARQLLLLSIIYAAARKRYNDGEVVNIPRQPFDGLDLRLPPSDGEDALDIDTMQRVIDARPADPRQAIALAAFVVSFGTMGANLADMYAARKFSGDVWRYDRLKTHNLRADHAHLEVVIEPRLAYHLSLLTGAGPLWLPALRRGNTFKTAAIAVNKGLRAWADENGVDRFTFYAARHTFATAARGPAGVEKATVDECLAHVGDFDLADIYAQRDWARINEANRRTLDLFSWAVD